MTISRIPNKQAKKFRIPYPNFGESRFPGSCQIPDPDQIFIVFPIPVPYFGEQIPDPENRPCKTNFTYANVLIPLRDPKISSHALVRLRGSLGIFQRAPFYIGDPPRLPSDPNLGEESAPILAPIKLIKVKWRSGSEFEAQSTAESRVSTGFLKKQKLYEPLFALLYSTVCVALSCAFAGARHDSSNMANWRVRDAVAEDVPDILRMIKVMKSLLALWAVILRRTSVLTILLQRLLWLMSACF